MLSTVGVASLDALMDEIVPADIRRTTPLALPDAETEFEYHRRLRTIADMNRVCRSYIGLGYHDTITPAVIQRNVFENPGWYTPYTPYQAEIAQGRLESLLSFQTMVTDLTGMDVANASLLDEATAAAEAVGLMRRMSKKADATVLLVADHVFPQVRALLASRAEMLGLTLRVGDPAAMRFDDDVFGAYLQSPDDRGALVNLAPVVARAHEAGALVAVGTDLLSLAMVAPPGEAGADVVVGNAQRFGVPLGYGGPHAAFFATRERFVRQMPGRIIGVSVDARGRRAYRMALQTREQHIRREKATSNICTAQALLANMAAFYAVYHGPAGLTAIASRVHEQARRLEQAVAAGGWRQTNAAYFDTLRLEEDPDRVARLRTAAESRGINFRYPSDGAVQISLNETVSEDDLADIVAAFGEAGSRPGTLGAGAPERLPAPFARTSSFLTHPVFNTHHSETEMMRYVRRLERRDLGLDTAMIPLGSCTMKLNAAAEMLPVSWPEFARMHPFAPAEQARGYRQIFDELEQALGTITGLPGVSLQPNSGAQGELAGLLVIQAFHAVAWRPDAGHRADPAIGSRHQSGQRLDGRHGCRDRGLRRPRQHRRGRSAREGGAASRATGVPDGDLPQHARCLRDAHP